MKAKSSAIHSAHAQSLAEDRLRAAAVRITAARVKVLTALIGADRAFSHQDVQQAFADMDRVTLYRALDCLTEAGLAHKIAGDDRISRYSAGAEHSISGKDHATQHQHGHFKCTRCAKVFCLDDGALGKTGRRSNAAKSAAKSRTTLRRQLQSALQETLGAGFQSHDIELTIKGWCAECAH